MNNPMIYLYSHDNKLRNSSDNITVDNEINSSYLKQNEKAHMEKICGVPFQESLINIYDIQNNQNNINNKNFILNDSIYNYQSEFLPKNQCETENKSGFENSSFNNINNEKRLDNYFEDLIPNSNECKKLFFYF